MCLDVCGGGQSPHANRGCLSPGGGICFWDDYLLGFLHSCNVRSFWNPWPLNGGQLGPGFEFILGLLEALCLRADTEPLASSSLGESSNIDFVLLPWSYP